MGVEFLIFRPTDLAVVPIFVNTGAALLPAILAGLVSVLALLFKPRELFRLCRERPTIPVAVVTVMALGAGGVWLWQGAADDKAVTDASTDWAGEAVDILYSQGWTPAAIDWQPPDKGVEPTYEPIDLPPFSPQVAGDVDFVYRGNNRRTGYAGGPSPTQLKRRWNHSEDGVVFAGAPIVAGDAVYFASSVFDAMTTYGSIYCLDADTGEERWITILKDLETFEAFRGFFSSPSISRDGKRLVIGQGYHEDANSELVCLNTADGSIEWLVPTPLHIEGSPAIAGDLVVAGAGAIESIDDRQPVGDPGYVFGVQLSTGKQLWKYAVNDPESSPAIEDGVVYIGSGLNGNAVVALRTETDEELRRQGLDRLIWKSPTPHPAAGCITLTEKYVLVGCGNGDYINTDPHPEGLVMAFDKATGELAWQVKLADAVFGAIAVHNGFAFCPVKSGDVVALDIDRQGKMLWKQRIHLGAPALAGVAVTDTHLYALANDGYLAVLDVSNGNVLETHCVNAPGRPGLWGYSTSDPFVTHGRVFVGSETGGVTCLAPRGAN